MNPVLAWFDEGAAGFLTAASLSLAIQLIGCAIAITYLAWVWVAAYTEWGNEDIRSGEMFVIWCRSIIALMVLLYLFTI